MRTRDNPLLLDILHNPFFQATEKELSRASRLEQGNEKVESSDKGNMSAGTIDCNQQSVVVEQIEEDGLSSGAGSQGQGREKMGVEN